MLRPALLNSGLIVFTLALEVLGLPLILGSASNVHFVSSYLYNNWINKVPSDQGLVSAGAIVLLATVTVLLVLRNKLTGDVARFTTTTGKPTATATLRLGPVRWLLSAIVAITLFLTMIVPLIGIVLQAFTTILTPFVSPWDVLTTDHFHAVFNNAVYRKAVRNSLLIATVGGALATVGIAILAVVAHRSTFRHRKSLAQVVLDRGGSFRGTLWAMGIAFAVRSLALGYSAFYPALAALGEDLDRAARTSGASWWMAMRHIVFRLVRPAIVVSFLLMFIAMLNDADPAVMLVGPNTQVMGLAMLQLSLSGVAGPVAAFGVIQLVITMVVLLIIKVITSGRQSHA
jgi:iron(III) transport system permease protein